MDGSYEAADVGSGSNCVVESPRTGVGADETSGKPIDVVLRGVLDVDTTTGTTLELGEKAGITLEKVGITPEDVDGTGADG